MTEPQRLPTEDTPDDDATQPAGEPDPAPADVEPSLLPSRILPAATDAHRSAGSSTTCRALSGTIHQKEKPTAYDDDRCFALANELIEAARDKHRAPGAIFYSDVMRAIRPIADALHQKRVPFATVATIMRDCATSFERELLVELEWYQNRKVTPEFGPPRGGKPRERRW
jgi:hypothetical protein